MFIIRKTTLKNTYNFISLFGINKEDNNDDDDVEKCPRFNQLNKIRKQNYL